MAPHYSTTGRPSIDPVLMIRMLLVGYLFGIRSDRRLCEDVELNLAYRWFCRLGLDGRVPDHSTFSKARHGRFRNSDLLRQVYESIVARCLAEGIASSRHVAVDGSLVFADANHDRYVAEAGDLPTNDEAMQAVRDYLTDLDAAAPDLEGVQRSPARCVSVTDPAAALSRKSGMPRFAYGMNAAVDTASGIVLDVEAAPERFADEARAARHMVDRMEARHGVRPDVLTADKAYGAGPFLAWLERRGIESHIPVIDHSGQTAGKLHRSAFQYDATQDAYICPQGKLLRPIDGKDSKRKAAGTIGYRARQSDCGRCPLRSDCTRGSMRVISRSIHEDVRDRAKARARTDAFARSQRLRLRVEHLFGAIKHNDGFRRVRLRGIRGPAEQFLMVAMARNLKRMVTLLAPSPKTPPSFAAEAAA
jgi:transposase